MLIEVVTQEIGAQFRAKQRANSRLAATKFADERGGGESLSDQYLQRLCPTPSEAWADEEVAQHRNNKCKAHPGSAWSSARHVKSRAKPCPGVVRISGTNSSSNPRDEENWILIVRPLDTFRTVTDAVGVGRTFTVHRSGGRGRTPGNGWSVLPGASLRSATGVTFSPARGGRISNQANRDWHWRHRYAL